MRKAPILSALILVSTFINTVPTYAVTVTATGTNPAVCNQDVTNSSGVSVSRVGNSCVIIFTTGTTTWTVPSGVTSLTYLVVGGGGGGGGGISFAHGGGGGGAGGYRTNNTGDLSGGGTVAGSAFSVAASSYSITVGNGGAGGRGGGDVGTNGGNSSFGTISTLGGGGGGVFYTAATTGGSGGGAGASNSYKLGADGTSNQGFKGGNSPAGTWNTNGGGGGGAGGFGPLAVEGVTPSPGGVGLISTITGSNVTRGIGGNGGTGSTVDVGATPSANLGNGGGGGNATSGSSAAGGNGSSGVVIIRYDLESIPPTFTSGTTFSVSENIATTSNAATITINESVTVTINAGSDAALFASVFSDSQTARIRFVSSPNFEAPADVGTNNVYDISIRATDSAGNFTNQSIAITVSNVNEAPSISIAASATTHSISQAENISSVITYTGSDVDSGTTLTWSLSGTDAADLTIGSATGVLSFASNPDFEDPKDFDTNNTYIFIVTLSDGTLTDTQTVTLTITNANESASLGTPSLSATPLKGVLLTITVTSNVAGRVAFTVDGKRITNCLAKSTSGSYPSFSATCSWKPTVMNRQSVTARITPTDNTFSASSSAPLSILVGRRTGLR